MLYFTNTTILDRVLNHVDPTVLRTLQRLLDHNPYVLEFTPSSYPRKPGIFASPDLQYELPVREGGTHASGTLIQLLLAHAHHLTIRLYHEYDHRPNDGIYLTPHELFARFNDPETAPNA